MVNVLLSGCGGSMGKVLDELIEQDTFLQVIAGFDSKSSDHNKYKVYNDLNDCNENIDIIIDFSHYSTFNHILEFALEKKVPLVIATTGLSDENEKELKLASNKIPVFRTANMSLGVNVVLNLVKQAASILSDSFDIEIIEKHHNKKLDAPSGTALMIANEINNVFENKKEYIYGRYGRNERKSTEEIGIHAVRGGTIPGEHTVIFAGNDEILEIKHTALSKNVFANGAIKAAKFILNKENGYFDMQMIVNN